MLRLSILSLYLCLVSAIGLTFGPFEDTAFQLYNIFSTLGTNPSFTPVTSDMSMMTNEKGSNNFAKPLQLIAYQSAESWRVFLPSELDLYRLKIPIILLLEQAAEGIDLKEARYAICHQLAKELGGPLISFAVTEGRIQVSDFLFQREFDCDFTPIE